MQPSLVLRTKTTASGNLLHLLVSIPAQTHLSADRAAVTCGPVVLEIEPLVLGSHIVFVNQQRSSLIRDDHVEDAAIPKIDKRDCPPVKNVTRSDGLRHVHKLTGAVVDPNSLLLITRQAASIHRGPLRGVGNDRRVAAGDLREVVPVVLISIKGDVTIDEIEIERAVVIQIAKLRAETPAADLDVHRAREIIVLDRFAARTVARHPEIVSLDQNSLFRNVRNVDRITSLVENVAHRRTHPALRREAHSGLVADFVKLSAIVEIQLRDPVVVGDEKIGMTVSAQVRNRCRERPAMRVDAELLTDFLKRSVAEIVEEILAPAVLRVLKTLRHHARVFQMP